MPVRRLCERSRAQILGAVFVPTDPASKSNIGTPLKLIKVAHPLPDPLVRQERLPVPADLPSPGQRPRVVDETQNVQGQLRRQLFQEIAFEQRGDSGGYEEEL